MSPPKPTEEDLLLAAADPAIPASQCITPDARTVLEETIHEAGGNEVFFFGSLDEKGHLREVEVVARGNAGAVPVFLERAGDHRVLIHNHPGGDLTPSPADLTIASEAGVRGLGFFIVDNEVERVYRVVEPFEPKDTQLLDEDEIASIFSADGLLAQAVPTFEDREGQRDLAVHVARSFNRGQVVAFEAGTGVGKSFAYLVPSILWASRNRSRVVISTQTIALQEQLIHKDLPSLHRVLEDPFVYSLIKGRSNYACRRKSGEVMAQKQLFEEDKERQHWNEEITDWLKHSVDGSLSDLARTPPAEVWDDFSSTTEQSLKVRCPHYRSCFYYEARRRAASAQIVVVNHHLFFADLSLRVGTGSYDNDLVIPGYKHVVFDEAHRLEEVASEHFGSKFSRLGVLQTLGRQLSEPGRSGTRERGRMMYVASVLRKHRAGAPIEHLEFELLPRIREVRDRVRELFGLLRERARPNESSEETGDPGKPFGASPMLRIGERPGELSMETLAQPLADLRMEMKLLQRDLRRGRELLMDHPFEPVAQYEGIVGEYRTALRRVDEQVGALDRFTAEGRGMLAWVEIDVGRAKNLLLRVAPVRVAELLAEHLYRPLGSVTMASATLSVDGEWDFLGDRLGWFLTEADRFRGAEFASPFDYLRQVCLVTPSDLPPPSHGSFSGRLAEVVLDAARIVGGKMFVLFTSHGALRAAASRTRGELSRLGFPVLVQGERPRTELLERFREAGNAVLFGNQSFWEGVDVPGSALSCVIIARLPFRVPTHPLELARAEEVESRGLNAFRNLTIPSAVLALKQGFGRLIRTAQDRGIVIIADSRVRSASYGSFFLRSLPECQRHDGTWEEAQEVMQAFLDE